MIYLSCHLTNIFYICFATSPSYQSPDAATYMPAKSVPVDAANQKTNTAAVGSTISSTNLYAYLPFLEIVSLQFRIQFDEVNQVDIFDIYFSLSPVSSGFHLYLLVLELVLIHYISSIFLRCTQGLKENIYFLISLTFFWF